MQHWMQNIPKRLWTPAKITTVLWLDAADANSITESAGAVSQWDDKSGNNNNAAQGTGANQPTLATDGGLTALYFDSTANKYLESPNHATLNFQNEGTFFTVIRDTDISANSHTWVRILSNDNPSLYMSMSNVAQPKFMVAENISAPEVLTWGTSSITTTIITSARFSTSLDTQRLSVNGETEVIQPATGITQIAQDGGLIRIGAQKTNTARFFDGYMHELIFIGGYLSDADKEKMEGYLAWKWGLESNLPSGHPYELSAPTI